MWFFQKKAEPLVDVGNMQDHPAPVVNDCHIPEEPAAGPVQECDSAPVADDHCISSVPAPAAMQDAVPMPGLPEDDMTRDLALRVMDALTVWRTKYHLEKLPDKIVLDQALNILYVMKNAL